MEVDLWRCHRPKGHRLPSDNSIGTWQVPSGKLLPGGLACVLRRRRPPRYCPLETRVHSASGFEAGFQPSVPQTFGNGLSPLAAQQRPDGDLRLERLNAGLARRAGIRISARSSQWVAMHMHRKSCMHKATQFCPPKLDQVDSCGLPAGCLNFKRLPTVSTLTDSFQKGCRLTVGHLVGLYRFPRSWLALKLAPSTLRKIPSRQTE
jgi:hypothetical protein